MLRILMLLITVIVLLGCNESRERMDSYKYESTTEDWNDFLYCWQKQTLSKLSTQEELYTEYEKEVFLRKNKCLNLLQRKILIS